MIENMGKRQMALPHNSVVCQVSTHLEIKVFCRHVVTEQNLILSNFRNYDTICKKNHGANGTA